MPSVRDIPADPQLARIAEALEDHGVQAELLDRKWRMVFLTGEMARTMGLPDEHLEPLYGLSMIARNLEFPDYWRPDSDSGRTWWELFGPPMVHDVPPGDPDFDAVFGPLAPAARSLEPAEPPLATVWEATFPDAPALPATWLGRVTFLFTRVYDQHGSLLGIVAINRGAISSTLNARMSRGDLRMFERMDRMSEPARRPAAILFADLESSGPLSRRLSSRAYFGLISSLTELIDDEVVARDGIVGKHAGDGASALFVAEPGSGGEAAAALAAIETGRAIAAGAPGLHNGSEPIRVNVGLHWGGALTVGQVSSTGRLEVTALGDEMNEAARIESAATGGAVLASKALIERIDQEGADQLGLDPGEIEYRLLAELGADEKAVRDAGGIAVTEL